MNKYIKYILIGIVFVAIIVLAFFGGRKYRSGNMALSEELIREQIEVLEQQCSVLQDSCVRLLEDKQNLQQEVSQLQEDIDSIVISYDKKIKSIRTYRNEQCDSAFRTRYWNLY